MSRVRVNRRLAFFLCTMATFHLYQIQIFCSRKAMITSRPSPLPHPKKPLDNSFSHILSGGPGCFRRIIFPRKKSRGPIGRIGSPTMREGVSPSTSKDLRSLYWKRWSTSLYYRGHSSFKPQTPHFSPWPGFFTVDRFSDQFRAREAAITERYQRDGVPFRLGANRSRSRYLSAWVVLPAARPRTAPAPVA